MAAFDNFKKEVKNLPADSPLHQFVQQYEQAADESAEELRKRQAKARQDRGW